MISLQKTDNEKDNIGHLIKKPLSFNAFISEASSPGVWQ